METKQYTTKTLAACEAEIKEQLTAIFKKIEVTTDTTEVEKLWRNASILKNKLLVCQNRQSDKYAQTRTAALVPDPRKLSQR